MKYTLHVLVRKGEVVQRQDFDLGDINVEDYDSSVHSGKVFNWPDTPDFHQQDNHVYLWKWASPETDKEKKYLEETGKMGFIKMKDL